MENREDDILKALFQKEVETHRETVEVENWDLIAANLEKKRFYKFSFSRFNVFYLTIIILSSLLSLTSFIYWINLTNAIGKRNSDSAINTDTTYIISKDSITDNPGKGILPPSTIISKRSSSLRSVSSDSTVNSQTTSKRTYSSTDSIFSSSPSPLPAQDTSLTVVPKEKPKTVVRKTVYKIKQDTLIKMDTVRTPAKKRKNK